MKKFQRSEQDQVINLLFYTYQKPMYLQQKDKKNFLIKPNYFYQLLDIIVNSFTAMDTIIITCGAPFVPKDLLNQLKIGGKMVAPVGVGDIQVMQLIEKIDEKNIKTTEHGNFSFVPMLNDKNH